jgi:hypothetical protein
VTAQPGDPDATTSAPITVTRVVEDGDHTIVVGPGENRRAQLRQVLHAACQHGRTHDLLIVAGSPQFSPMSDNALDRLLAHRDVRDAFDLTITPLAADRLSGELELASRDPKRCDNHCGRSVEDGVALCEPCDHLWSQSERLTVDYRPGRAS